MSSDNNLYHKKHSKIFNRAVKYFEEGHLQQADALVCEILQQNPQNADALHLYGLLAYRVRRYNMAANLISQAIQLKPGSAIFHNNLGMAMLSNGNRAEANKEFRYAVQLKPNYHDAIINLADSLEKSNEIKEAHNVITQGLRLYIDDPQLLLTKAKLYRRDNDYEHVIKTLHVALRNSAGTPLVFIGETNKVLGQAYDRIGDYETAFKYFEAGNSCLLQYGTSLGFDKNNYNILLDELDSVVSPALKEVVPVHLENKDNNPVFLVGFPRSGTTLLDQILSSHSSVITLEEKPTVDLIHEEYYRSGNGRLPMLDAIPTDLIKRIQKDYVTAIGSYAQDCGNKTIIDKMPLNTWRAPMLWRTFPDAKYIVVIRHPCDACLSCFMQYFTINDAMSNFYTLTDAAMFYSKVMSLWIKHSSMLPLNYRVVRYEDLINNLEHEARGLISYLDLEWESGILDYVDSASNNKEINTPSYHQVAQPIYKHAEYRWERYEKHFEPIMETLAPFIDHFGYSM